MNPRIAKALNKLFETHRIIFWYDAKSELGEEFEALELNGIEKLRLSNNEFGAKHLMLREEPQQKFLVFRQGPRPDDLDNWLLDVELAHGEFRTDQIGIWLSELGLTLDFAHVIEPHAGFCQSVKRKEQLKDLLTPDDTPGMIRLKMLSVCAGAEPRLGSILLSLLHEMAQDRDERMRLIHRCNLANFLWEQVNSVFGYESNEPGLKDFVIELFKDCYLSELGGASRISPKLTGDALVFLKRWKDSRRFEGSFTTLSEKCAEALGMEQIISGQDFRELMDLDFFRLIDQKIISDLVRGIVERTLSWSDVSAWVRKRRQSHWYHEFEDLYQAIEYSAGLIFTLEESTLSMESLSDGIRQYSQTWFRLDQLYRKFIYHARCSGHASLLRDLIEQIENLYCNKFLLRLNDQWQIHVDSSPKWEARPFFRQDEFFRRFVEVPFLEKDLKVCVIISDALRYETGEELLGLIRREDRYEAELEPLLSMLPSYTQLGMAALLPHNKLALADNDSSTVLVDGQSSSGITNRAKIMHLASIRDKRATALKTDELMKMKKEDCRVLVKENDVIYIYHNRIDLAGDKRDSEDQVFEAVEKTLQDMIRLVKKLTGANANNLLITSDHGFLYQDRPIEESDFSGSSVHGDKIFFRDRRFILGKGLSVAPGLHSFSSSSLGLDGDMEIQIPRSINRLRLSGSGSRFVHGGASLQEVVIPVISVNKKRKSDVSVVEINILPGASNVITSGQLAVGFYQTTPSTDKVKPRVLRAGIYTLEGELISDSHDLTFDIISDNPRDRESRIRFLLTSKADKVNNQEVILRLTERISGTGHYKEYKSLRYIMRRSFTSDFDF